ncbi:hypothetical protein [Citricoccus alkalitolerans]|uniref:Uncharacterized protein n=1 Tax=Citricoccus alkalitolerans TaxID=246603 RepID=A0ABV8Y2Q2_9MICC
MDTTCWFPTGTGADRWQPASLAGIDLAPAHDVDAMVQASSMLAATPHWLRRDNVSDVLGDPMERAGISSPAKFRQRETIDSTGRNLTSILPAPLR